MKSCRECSHFSISWNNTWSSDRGEHREMVPTCWHKKMKGKTISYTIVSLDKIPNWCPRKGKKYQIIYADPPWEFGSVTKLGNARNYYKTMTFDELSKLELPSDTNCLLFLWVVGNKMKECMQVAEKWGFKYVNIGFVWHKPNRTLCGYYTMNQTELCLIFKKGKIPMPRGSRNVVEFLSKNATVHSRKPDEIRLRIVRMFPSQNKIELFAREKMDGWDAWGNEIESDIELE